MDRRLRTAAALALLALAAVVSGCLGPRYAREVFHESRDLEIVLRSQDGVDPGYEHPVAISAVRLAHILASLDVRFDDQEMKNARTPAVPLDLLYPLGEQVSRALAAARSDQEVVVMAQERSRNLKVFTDKRLTSFLVYMKNDQLVFHLSRVDWPLPANPRERVREPEQGKELMSFKVLPAKAIVPIGQQAAAVEWRDPSFRKASAIRLRPGGRIQRRTVLMEEPEALAPEETPPGDVVDLSELGPDALRALADLEEERRSGAVGEAEYRARRRRILESAAEPAP